MSFTTGYKQPLPFLLCLILQHLFILVVVPFFHAHSLRPFPGQTSCISGFSYIVVRPLANTYSDIITTHCPTRQRGLPLPLPPPPFMPEYIIFHRKNNAALFPSSPLPYITSDFVVPQQPPPSSPMPSPSPAFRSGPHTSKGMSSPIKQPRPLSYAPSLLTPTRTLIENPVIHLVSAIGHPCP